MNDITLFHNRLFKGFMLICLGIALTLGAIGFRILLFIMGCLLIGYGLVISGILDTIHEIVRHYKR